MITYCNFNGNIIRSNEPVITADNRGFRYGDGIFETIRVENNLIILPAYHFERLFSGLKLLQFDLPSSFTSDALAKQIADICRKNNHANARVRLVVFRGSGGLYDPENHFPNYIIQSSALSSNNEELNKKGLIIDIFPGGRKAIDIFSNLKSNNYLVYAMGALYAKKNKLDDCFILNSREHICDSTIANIFYVKEKKIFTTPLAEGCVAGVMRRYLLEKLPEIGFAIEEQPINPSALISADEIFLTNAIFGIRWIANYRGHSYKNDITSLIYHSLIKNIPG